MQKEDVRTLCLLTYVDTFMRAYDKNEQTKLQKQLHLKLNKHIKKFLKKIKPSEFDKLFSIADNAWNAVIKREDSPIIELSVVMLHLYYIHPRMHKYGISETNIAKFYSKSKRPDAATIESNSRYIAVELYNELSRKLELDEYQRISWRERANKQKEN